MRRAFDSLVLLALLALLAGGGPATGEDGELLPEGIVVLDEEGQPLANARLRACGRAQVGMPILDPRGAPLARSDAAGRLTLPPEARDVAADPPYAVEAPGRVPQPLFLLTPAGRLALPRGVELSGRVRWSKGPSVAGARLLLLPAGGRRGLGLALSTDAEGRWRTDQAGSGVSKLLLERADGRRVVLRAFESGQAPPDLVAPTGGGLAGRLLDVERRAPAGIPGAAGLQVALARLPREPAAVALTLRTDADGRFLAGDLAAGVYEVTLLDPDWHVDEDAAVVEVPDTGALREAAWAVRRRPAVVGRALDADGKPLAGVRVRLLPEAGAVAPRASGPAPSLEGQSGPDGRFRLARALPGPGQRLLLTAPTLSPLLSEPFPVGTQGETDAGSFRLLSGWTLEVDVRDPVGRPVSGATLRATPAEQPGAGLQPELAALERTATTGLDGLARVSALPRQDAFFTLEAPGHLPVAQRVALPGVSGSVRLRLELAAAPELRGRVLDALGRPAAERSVRALAPGPEPTVVASAQTDADGTFRLVGLVERPHEIEVLGPGSRPLLRVPGVAPADGPLELTLPADAAVTGSVEGLRPDGPTALALLEAQVLDARGERRWRVVEQSTLPRGIPHAFFRFEGLTPGEYSVRVIQGALDSDALPAMVDGRDVDLPMLRLGEPGTLAGSVLDLQGRPRLGVPVRLRRMRGDGDLPELPGGPWSTVSDERGDYLFSALGAGLWRVEAGEPAQGQDAESVRLVEGESLVVRDLVPTAGALLEGRVAGENGAPMDGARVRARPVGQDVEPRETRTRPDGGYRLEGLAAGLWRVEVAFGPRQSRAREALVEVQQGATVQLDFVPPTVGEIAGTVTRAGERVAGVTVRLSWEPPDGGTLRQERRDVTDALGVYRFEGLDPGAYRLLIDDGAARTGGEVLLGEGDRLTADLELWDARVSGEVLDGSGHPVSHAVVRAEPSVQVVGELGAEARSGPDGRFVLAGLPVGRYDLTVLARGRVEGRRSGVLADVAGADRPVTIVLGRGGEVDIEVRGPDGRPVGGARIDVAAADAPELESVSAVTGPSGRVRVTGVSPGTVLATAYARDMGRVSGKVTVAEGETARLDLRMEPAGTLLLSVEADGVDPTPRARIDVVSATGQVVARRRPLGPVWLEALWGREPRTGQLRLSDLAPGDYELRINAGPRFEPAKAQVRIQPGEATRASVKLAPSER